MARLAAVLLALAVVPALAARADELTDLVKQLHPPARFAGHKPAFTTETIAFRGQTDSGPQTNNITAIKDGEKYVALFCPEDYGVAIELLTPDPAKAPAKLTFPARLHHATQFGFRMTGITWFDKWGVTADKFEAKAQAKGDTVLITTKQTWTPDGKYQRNGTSTHSFTLRLDPVLGYTVEGTVALDTDKLATDKAGKPKTVYEFMNLLPPRLADPWPDRASYAFTAFSFTRQPAGQFTGWANNWLAAEASDDDRIERNPMRDGGLVAFLPDTRDGKPDPDPLTAGWGYAMARTAVSGIAGFHNDTCNVWQDQHNHMHLTGKPDADGRYRAALKLQTAFLPPELVASILKNTTFRFADKASVMPRLGVLEDFEDQPQSWMSPRRGIRIDGLKLATDEAHSGKKSIVVQGRDPAKARPYDFFSTAPQISCDPNSRYRIEAWVKPVGENTTAHIAANTYEWTPHDPKRLQAQKTTVAKAGDWQKIQLEFDTPAHDIYVDLRFVVDGPGKAYFDDFQFMKLPGR